MTVKTALRFHRWYPSLLLGLLFSAAALGLVGNAVAYSVLAARLFCVVVAFPVAVLAVRAFRSSTLILTDAHLTVRTLLRRRRWPIEQVSSAAVDTGYVGAYRRSYPVIRFSDGSEYPCREINTSPERADELAPLVHAMNEAVARA